MITHDSSILIGCGEDGKDALFEGAGEPPRQQFILNSHLEIGLKILDE
jgi:hypothetical protein